MSDVCVTCKAGEYACVAMYEAGESMAAVHDENGAREEPMEGLAEGYAAQWGAWRMSER